MLDPLNKVITIVKYKIKAKCPNGGESTSATPPSFPFVAFKQIDNATTAEDMENNENAVNSVIEITVFSNKNITEARNIMSLVCDEMQKLGYQRKGPFEPKNVSDTNIYRMIYRFNRIIGVGEEF